MRSQRWLLGVVLLCVTACTYVAQLQFGLSETLSSQARKLASTSSDQLYAYVWGEPSPVLRVEQLQSLPAVKSVAAERRGYAYTQPRFIIRDGKATRIPGPSFLAVQASYFNLRGATLAAGRFFSVGEHSAAVAVIGAKAAADFGWHVGDVVGHPDVKNKFTIIGELDPVETTESVPDKVLGLGVDDYVLVPFDNPAIVEFHDPALGPDAGQYINSDYSYWIQVKPGMLDEGIKQVRDCLKALAPEGVWVSVAARSRSSALKIAGENFASSFGIVTWVIYAVSAVAFSSVFLARVTSRAKEIGIRRAIGLSGRRAAWGVAVEALLLSTLGTALATLAFMCTHRLFGIGWGQSVSPIRELAPLMTLSVLLGPLGVIAPAEVAARISPMSSIRDELGWGSQRRRLDLRQSYALISLSLAVATVCFASSLGLSTVSAVDKQLQTCGIHDVEVASTAESSANVGMTQYEQLQAILPSGTPISLVQRRVASTWSPDGVEWAGVSLLGCDGDTQGALGYTCSVGTIDTPAEDELVLGSELASMLGNERAVGMTVMVGPEGKPFRVAGVLQPRPKNAEDRLGDRNRSIILSRAGLSHVANPVDSMARLVVRCADQDSADNVIGLAKTALGGSYQAAKPFGSLKALRALRMRFTTCILLGSVALSLAVAVAVGIIMIIRMWETRRSMAIQIAVGSTSRQVAISGGIDMLTVTLAATGVGVVLGLGAYVVCMVARKLPLQIGLGGALITASLGLLIAGVLGAICFLFFRGKSVAQYLHD